MTKESKSQITINLKKINRRKNNTKYGKMKNKSKKVMSKITKVKKLLKNKL